MYVLLGARGQLGTALARVLPPDTWAWGRNELDVSQPDEITKKLNTIDDVTCVINAAAITDVDWCEKNSSSAFSVNAYAPGAIAEWCMKRNVYFVHVSTDYVYGADTTRRMPYVESDPPLPINVYGHSKYQGERLIQNTGGNYLIARTSGLYGGGERSSDFVHKIITLARQHTVLSAAVDQIYSPTWVDSFVSGLVRLIGENARGIIHLVDVGAVSRYEMISKIITLAGFPHEVHRGRQEDFPMTALRPTYSPLISERIELAAYMRPWEEALRLCISDYKELLTP